MIEVVLEHLPHGRRRIGVVRDRETDTVDEQSEGIWKKERTKQLRFTRGVLMFEQQPHPRIGAHHRNGIPRTIERNRGKAQRIAENTVAIEDPAPEACLVRWKRADL